MAEYRKLLLQASTTSLLFNTPRVETIGFEDVFLEVVTTCSAPNLICDFTVGYIIDPVSSGRVLNADNQGAQICANQTGYSFNNGYVMLINNPPVGTSRFFIRMGKPSRFMGTYHTYSSGGGTVDLQVWLWGWGKMTTGDNS